jgi:hypothetical protein
MKNEWTKLASTYVVSILVGGYKAFVRMLMWNWFVSPGWRWCAYAPPANGWPATSSLALATVWYAPFYHSRYWTEMDGNAKRASVCTRSKPSGPFTLARSIGGFRIGTAGHSERVRSSISSSQK